METGILWLEYRILGSISARNTDPESDKPSRSKFNAIANMARSTFLSIKNYQSEFKDLVRVQASQIYMYYLHDLKSML